MKDGEKHPEIFEIEKGFIVIFESPLSKLDELHDVLFARNYGSTINFGKKLNRE